MSNYQEEILEFRKYLKKLLTILQLNCIFSFMGIRLYNKNLIDDVLCCIEGSWPENYRKYVAKTTSNILSYGYYKQLILAIKNRFMLSSSVYSIKYHNAVGAIDNLMLSIEQDMRYINSL